MRKRRKNLNRDCQNVEDWYENKLVRVLRTNSEKARVLLEEYGGPIKFGLTTREDAADHQMKRVLHLILPEGVAVDAAPPAGPACNPPTPDIFQPDAKRSKSAANSGGGGCDGLNMLLVAAAADLSEDDGGQSAAAFSSPCPAVPEEAAPEPRLQTPADATDPAGAIPPPAEDEDGGNVDGDGDCKQSVIMEWMLVTRLRVENVSRM